MAEVGDIGVADVSALRHGYQVCRVVKPNRLGAMWTVEVWSHDWDIKDYGFGLPVRRKVSIWHPLDNADPAAIHLAIEAARSALWAEQRKLAEEYHARIALLTGAGQEVGA